MATDHLTCSVDYCNRAVQVKHAGLCDLHYRRIRKTGTAHRSCGTCGADIEGDPKGRTVYCGKSCAECQVVGCSKDITAKGLCSLHYVRSAKGVPMDKVCETCGGDLPKYSGQSIYCCEDCRPRCQESNCDRPFRYSNGYCAMHGVSFARHGKPEGAYKWTEASSTYICLACGIEFEGGAGSRKFCGAACQQLYRTYDGNIPPLEFDCALCGERILRDRFAQKYQRGDKRFCDRCSNSRKKRHKTSAGYLALRDGNTCKLCGEEVDMLLRFPNKLAGSVDHIVPVALGGGHEGSNLQLAHYTCNSQKQARMIDRIPPTS